MTQLVYFCDDSEEAVVIDTQGLTEKQLEDQYGRSVSSVIKLDDEQADDISTWPCDRELK